MTDTSSPWLPGLLVTGVTALSALVGASAAFLGVSRRRKGEHEDVICRRYKRDFENYHDGRIIANREMQILEANRQARAITGWGNELVGRTIYDLIPTRFHEQHRKHVRYYFNDPHVRKMGTATMRIVLVDRRGEEKDVFISLSPAEDDYGSYEIGIGIQVKPPEQESVRGAES